MHEKICRQLQGRLLQKMSTQLRHEYNGAAVFNDSVDLDCRDARRSNGNAAETGSICMACVGVTVPTSE
jgi:hypothetical protein